jgi:hypothetical protein
MHHVKDEMLKPNLKTVFGGPIPKMEGLSKVDMGDARQARVIYQSLT